jgi:protease-4
MITLLFGGGLVLLSALGSSGGPAVGTATAGGGFFMFGDRIAILEVNGVLGEGPGYGADTAALIKQLKAWEDNASIKGIVVRINSPGGAVSATQELHQALENYKQRTKRPVVASMGDVAASGGYYAAMSADRVFANPGTLTGSIGVIMSSWQYDSLTDKIGVKERVIKSGEFKDIMSGARDMTESERALMETMVMDVYSQFLDHVTLNRRETVKRRMAEKTGVEPSGEDVAAKIRGVADGRVFSGRQAFEDGMVDELGTLDDAVAHAAQLAGLKTGNKQIPTVSGPVRPRGLFGKMESRLEQATRALPGTVLLEYRLHM